MCILSQITIYKRHFDANGRIYLLIKEEKVFYWKF